VAASTPIERSVCATAITATVGRGKPLTPLRDPQDAFDAFDASARRLDEWHAGGRRGPRPPGRLRRHHPTPLPASTARWAEPLYRILFDPDGRPRPLRRAGAF
jgi:hypothetical protein